jgi:cephalosporin-C deacetylase-like acetyl esterase
MVIPHRAVAAGVVLCLCLRAERILLQVEDFAGPWQRQNNIEGYSGTGFCTSNANPHIAETVMAGQATIEVAGTYGVWVRGYTSENSPRAFAVAVNGQRLPATHAGRARRWIWERAGTVELAAGVCAITVHDADTGFETADAVLLTNEKEFDPMAEERRWLVFGEKIPESADALRFAIQACCRLLVGRELTADSAVWEAQREQAHERLAAAMGLSPLPARTPLNARVTGRAERDAYTIENVVLESRPRFYVTANLYLPKGVPGPVPGVVVVPGHAMDDGKNYGLYQTAQIGLARLGFAVLAYDPIGQGERKLPGYSHNLGYGALLAGQTNEGLITWDTLRTVDYLTSRPEVDPQRIGLTGNSGGGENTFYAMPFDTRIKVGAAFCFVCSYHEWLREGGNHCICNHLPGVIRDLEQAHILALRVPRPVLVGNGAKDPIFPIAGTRETLRQATALYAAYGAADRIAAVEVPEGHGWHQALREAAYGWFAKWLQGRGDGSPIPEPEGTRPEDPKSADLLCFAAGQGLPADAETVVTLSRSLAAELASRYPEVPAGSEAWREVASAWRRRLWDQLGGEPPAYVPAAAVVDRFEWEGATVQAVALTVEEGLQVAALFIRPVNSAGALPVVVTVDDRGKASVRSSPLVRRLLAAGFGVFALDPRGSGETEVHENHLVSNTVCLGRPLLAQRVWDVMQSVRFLRSAEAGEVAEVCLYGRGSSGLLGVFAAALGCPLARVVAEGTPASYRFALEDSQPQPIWVFAPGLLTVADVPQAVALAAPTPLALLDPVGYGRSPLPLPEASAELGPAAAAYALLGNAAALQIGTGGGEDALFGALTHTPR